MTYMYENVMKLNIVTLNVNEIQKSHQIIPEEPNKQTDRSSPWHLIEEGFQIGQERLGQSVTGETIGLLQTFSYWFRDFCKQALRN